MCHALFFNLITKVFTTKISDLYILHSAQNNNLFILFHFFIYLPKWSSEPRLQRNHCRKYIVVLLEHNTMSYIYIWTPRSHRSLHVTLSEAYVALWYCYICNWQAPLSRAIYIAFKVHWIPWDLNLWPCVATILNY